MAKKLTRAEIQTELLKRSANIESTIIASGHVEFVDWIAVRPFVEAGLDKFECRCSKCGSVYVREGSYYRYGSSNKAKCPTCGNSNETTCSTPSHPYNGQRAFFAITTDYGADFAIYSHTYHYPSGDDWRMKDPVKGIKLSYYGMFHREYGWCVYSFNDEKLCRKDSNDENNALYIIKNKLPVNIDDVPSWNVVLAEAKLYEKKREQTLTERRANSKTKVMEDLRSGYKCKDIDLDRLANSSPAIMKKVYTRDDYKTTYLACCTRCGSQYIVDSDSTDESCPSCGFNTSNGSTLVRHTAGSMTRSTNAAVFENTNLPDNDLLLRVFNIEWTFDEHNCLSKNVRESQRVFLGKKMYVYNMKLGKAEKATVRDLSSCLGGWYHSESVSMAQTNDEIATIIKNSCHLRNGLLESYGLGDERYEKFKDAPNLQYISCWYKNPAIEIVLKANMPKVTEFFVSHIDQLFAGSSIAEVLGVAPMTLKTLGKTNPTRDELRAFDTLFREDNSITKELYGQIAAERLSVSVLAHLKRVYNISYTKTMSYLQSAYDHQCISKIEALNTWSDYLRMASMLKIDLTDKSRKFPASLKKEHDVAMFAYKSVQIELDKELFAKQAEINQYYEYSYKELMVIIPKTPQDIIEEATRQKNCLRSYVDSVKHGRTVVAFVRRKEFPNNSYVTAEIHANELIQLKGYCNSNPRDKEIEEFVEHWSKAKKFSLRYK